MVLTVLVTVFCHSGLASTSWLNGDDFPEANQVAAEWEKEGRTLWRLPNDDEAEHVIDRAQNAGSGDRNRIARLFLQKASAQGPWKLDTEDELGTDSTYKQWQQAISDRSQPAPTGSTMKVRLDEHGTFKRAHPRPHTTCEDRVESAGASSCTPGTPPADNVMQSSAALHPVDTPSLCVMWRQTSSCNGKTGARQATLDRPCDEKIGGHASGYCECIGAPNFYVDCNHAPFDCQTICDQQFRRQRKAST